MALGLAQADAIDDGGMVQGIGDNRILGAEQGLEQAAVGVEAGGVENRVLGAEEIGNGLFQLLVQVLGAADKAYRGHAETAFVERLVRRGDHFLVVCQAEVVVGAEIQHFAAVLDLDLDVCGVG